MWKTPSGNRKLQGAERRLFICALLHHVQDLFDFSEDQDDIEDDSNAIVPILQDIPARDLPYYFILVARMVLNDDPPPKFFAWNEAIIYELFGEMEVLLDYDIEDGEDGGYYRRLILDASEECFDKDWERPSIESKDKEEWTLEIDALSNRLLWDEDFLMGSIFAKNGTDYWAKPPFLGIKQRGELKAFMEALQPENTLHWKNFKKTGQVT